MILREIISRINEIQDLVKTEMAEADGDYRAILIQIYDEFGALAERIVLMLSGGGKP